MCPFIQTYPRLIYLHINSSYSRKIVSKSKKVDYFVEGPDSDRNLTEPLSAEIVKEKRSKGK